MHNSFETYRCFTKHASEENTLKKHKGERRKKEERNKRKKERARVRERKE